MSKLPAQSRHQSIIALVRSEKSISISDMAQNFGVTTETIRRDLLSLEGTGELRRVHGGAVASDRHAPLVDRMEMERPGKDAIARRVAAMIEADQWLFLPGGSTALALAQALRDRPKLAVMTNMPAIADVLQSGRHHEVWLTGGRYNSHNRMLEGPEVLQAMERCSFDLAILPAFGLEQGFGMLEFSRHTMELKRRAMELSRRNICLIDHSKVAAPGRFQSISFKEMDMLVTDRPLPAPYPEILTQAGVEVICAEEEAQDAAPAQPVQL